MNELKAVTFSQIESVLRGCKKYPGRLVKFHVMPR